MRALHIVDAVFWGGALIVVGILLITGHIAAVKFSWWRILIAIFFFYIGVRVLVGGFVPHSAPKGSVILSEEKVEYSSDIKEYNAIFGNAKFDLSEFGKDEKKNAAKVNAIFASADASLLGVELARDAKLEANAIFGKAVIRIPKGVPYIVNASAAFGHALTPKHASIAFGETTEASGGEGYALTIKASAVFGALEIVEE